MSTGPELGAAASGVSRRSATVLLAWLGMVGFDLFLHAGLLAPLYDWDSPFLLQPEEAFVRIPIGYLSFLIAAVLLAWVLPRLDVRDGRQGALMAGAIGAAAWGVVLLGLWSISTADLALLVGWWIGQALELALGGFVIGAVLGGTRLRTVAWRVGALLVLAAASAVVLQSVGYATAPVVIR